MRLDPKPIRVKECQQAIEQAADDKILESQSLGRFAVSDTEERSRSR